MARQFMARLRAAALGLIAIVAAAAPFQASFAQAFPNRPITLIYPYPAGSTTDNAWRLIAQEASRTLGQNVVVENRAGASGRIGLDAVSRAANKEGYTIGVINNTLSVLLPLMDATFKVEPGKDYTPVTGAIETYAVLVANPSVPFKDLAGLISYAKDNPGKLNIASAGTGTPSHLAGELLARSAGIRLTHIPYKGEAPALADLLGGQVQLYFGVGILKPHVEAGRLIGIATTGPQRWNSFPNLPSFTEAGFPGVLTASWLGVIGPPGMAEESVNQLNRAFGTALRNPELRKKLEEQGWVLQPSTPQEFAARIGTDVERWTPIIRAANIKVNP